MPKYEPDTSHWEDDGPERWVEETSADIEINVRLHKEGYQEDRKWTVHLTHRPADEDMPPLTALYAVEHQNKGNFWREGDLYDDAVDFEELPYLVRYRVAAIVGRDEEEITPDEPLVHREDGTGVGDGRSLGCSGGEDSGH